MDAEDLYFEGLDLFAEQRWLDAVAKFEEAAQADPSYVDAYHGIARACFAAREEDPGALDSAIAAALRIVELTPDDVTGYSTLSQVYVWKGDKETAEHWGSKARIAGWKDQLVEDKRRNAGKIDPSSDARKLS